MLSSRPRSSRLGVCHLSKVLMVIVPQRGSLHKFTLVRGIYHVQSNTRILRPVLATLMPSPRRPGLPLTRRVPGTSRKTRAHQTQVSLI